MASSSVIDTHELIKELKQVGFDERQAEMQVHVVQLICNITEGRLRDETDRRELASLADIKQIDADLKFEIRQLDFKLSIDMEKVRGEIEKAKNNMLIWMFGMFITQTGIFIGLFGKALDLF